MARRERSVVRLMWLHCPGQWFSLSPERLYFLMVKDQQMHHSFNVLVLKTLLHVSAFLNAIIRESNMNMLRWCLMSWEAEKDGSCILWRCNGRDVTKLYFFELWQCSSRELYIVTDGVMVGMLQNCMFLSCDSVLLGSCILWQTA
jgi:hypothetical protein